MIKNKSQIILNLTINIELTMNKLSQIIWIILKYKTTNMKLKLNYYSQYKIIYVILKCCV